MGIIPILFTTLVGRPDGSDAPGGIAGVGVVKPDIGSRFADINTGQPAALVVVGEGRREVVGDKRRWKQRTTVCSLHEKLVVVAVVPKLS